MLDIITDREAWKRLIPSFPVLDFYHTWDYHELSKGPDETALLIHYKQGEQEIALPLIKRPISGTDYFDLTSVYGYAGPLSKGIDFDFDPNDFSMDFHAFMKEHRIVSVFSRLNPYIPMQDEVIRELGTVEALGPIVNIDLTADLEIQRANYSKTTKRYVNRLRRTCEVVKGATKEDILRFIHLYTDTMERVDATDYYFFDEEYYFKFLKSEDFEVDLLFAQLKDTKEYICGAMMVKTGNIVQYHLSGTLRDYLSVTPLRLLIDETRIQATQDGYTSFNLGGGLGSAEDSLFFFKSSLSKEYKTFSVWKYIADEKAYKELCEIKREKVKDEGVFENSRFFPLYRIEA